MEVKVSYSSYFSSKLYLFYFSTIIAGFPKTVLPALTLEITTLPMLIEASSPTLLPGAIDAAHPT